MYSHANHKSSEGQTFDDDFSLNARLWAYFWSKKKNLDYFREPTAWDNAQANPCIIQHDILETNTMQEEVKRQAG